MRRCERCEDYNQVRIDAGLLPWWYPPHHADEHFDPFAHAESFRLTTSDVGAILAIGGGDERD